MNIYILKSSNDDIIEITNDKMRALDLYAHTEDSRIECYEQLKLMEQAQGRIHFQLAYTLDTEVN